MIVLGCILLIPAALLGLNAAVFLIIEILSGWGEPWLFWVTVCGATAGGIWALGAGLGWL